MINVSQIALVPESATTQAIQVFRADGTKCERCWNTSLIPRRIGPWPVVCGQMP